MKTAAVMILLGATHGFASTLFLTGVATPGTAGLNVTFQVQEHRLNLSDVPTTTSNPSGVATSTNSSADWSSDFGLLHVGANTLLPEDSSGNSFNTSLANLAASWTDFILLTPTGNPGPVQLLLTIALHGTLTADYSGGAQTAFGYGGAGIDDLTLGNRLRQEQCTESNCTANISDDSGLNASSAIFDVTNCAAGCYVGLVGWMEVFTQLDNIFEGQTGRFGSVIADYRNTATFHIDILTPGWSMTSLSGANYATTAVPEPSTGLVVGCALLLGCLVRKAVRKNNILR